MTYTMICWAPLSVLLLVGLGRPVCGSVVLMVRLCLLLMPRLLFYRGHLLSCLVFCLVFFSFVQKMQEMSSCREGQTHDDNVTCLTLALIFSADWQLQLRSLA